MKKSNIVKTTSKDVLSFSPKNNLRKQLKTMTWNLNFNSASFGAARCSWNRIKAASMGVPFDSDDEYSPSRSSMNSNNFHANSTTTSLPTQTQPINTPTPVQTDGAEIDAVMAFLKKTEAEDDEICCTESLEDEDKYLQKIDQEDKKNKAGVEHVGLLEADGTPSGARLARSAYRILKDQQYRREYVRTVLGLKWENIEDRVKIMMFESVGPVTFRQYASHWNVMTKAGMSPLANPAKYKTWTSALETFLANCPAKYSNNSLGNWTAAMKLRDDINDDSNKGSQERLKRLLAGYRNNNVGGRAKERGAITRDKLEKLCNRDGVKGTFWEIGFRFQFAAGLRTSQISGAVIDDLRCSRDKAGNMLGYIYSVEKIKDKNKSKREAWENHLCAEQDTEFLTKLIEDAEENRNGMICPEWNEQTAVKLVKECAVAENWDPSLEWVNHGIRHGAILEAAEESKDQTVEGRRAAARDRGQQEADVVLDRCYLRTQWERELCARAHKLMDADKTNRCELEGMKISRSVRGLLRFNGKKQPTPHADVAFVNNNNSNLTRAAFIEQTKKKRELEKKKQDKSKSASFTAAQKRMVETRSSGAAAKGGRTATKIARTERVKEKKAKKATPAKTAGKK